MNNVVALREEPWNAAVATKQSEKSAAVAAFNWRAQEEKNTVPRYYAQVLCPGDMVWALVQILDL